MGADSPVLAMKLCSAQLKHQCEALTAKPHSLVGSQAGKKNESGVFSLE